MIWLDNSRIIAICAVVVLHTAAGVVLGNAIGSEYWWIGNLFDASVRWCVPVFVMISGALLLDPNKTEDLKTFYTKRLSRIVVPILFWSVFYQLWVMRSEGSTPSMVMAVRHLISGKSYYHMWFLYMIAMLYLFTPFFRKVVAHSTRRELSILVIITFMVAALHAIGVKVFSEDSKLFTSWFLPYVPFYFLGYLLRIDDRHFSKTILWCTVILSACLTALGYYLVSITRGTDAGSYFYGSASVTVIPLSISMMYLLKTWTTPIWNEKYTRALSLLTLGVYLIHPIALETLQHFGFGPLNFYPAVSIPVVAVIVSCSSFIVAWVIQQMPYLKRVI